MLGPKLWGVRLDTPASRRGDFLKIAEEVRWELDIRGGKSVKIIASGRLDMELIQRLNLIVDGYGIGTAVAYPPVVDLSAKIVEVTEGSKKEFRAKRGGLGGRKAVYRSAGVRDFVALEGSPKPNRSTPLLKPLLKNGRMARSFDTMDEIRARVKTNLDELKSAQPSLSWR